MAFNEEIAAAMMENSGEIPAEGEEEMDSEEGGNEDIILNVADELSTLTGKDIAPEQVKQLVDAIVNDEESEEDSTKSEPSSALPNDFS